MAVEFRAYLRDSDVNGYALLGEITEWLSFTAIKRKNALGTWKMVINRSGPTAALITKQSGVVIKREGVTIFSGSVGSEFTTTATTLTVAGYCDNALLDRPALPDTDGPPYVEQFWGMTAVVSAVMSQLVYENVGAGARIDRRAAQFVVPTDPGLGDVITVDDVRFDNLLSYLARLAVRTGAGDLQFQVQQSDTDLDTVEFTITAPRDQRAFALFSIESGTAADYTNAWGAPPANYFYLGAGDGLGKDRTILEGGNAASITEVGRQIEAFIDVRGVTDAGEHARKLQEAIDGAVPSRKVTVTPFQVRSLEYVDDYQLGDLVTFVADGDVLESVIREVEITLTNDRGAIVTPMLGDPGTTRDSDLPYGRVSRQLEVVHQRVSNLERHYDLPDEGVNLPMIAIPARVPIGQISPFAGASPPAGWVLANGQAISRATYADLFTYIGVAYGAGNGTTTFNVPNLVDRVVIGSGGAYGTGATGNLPLPAHTHPGTHDHDHDHDHDTDIDHNHPSFTSGSGSGDSGSHTHAVNPPALGSTNVNSNNASPSTTDSASTDTAADYTGSSGTPYFAGVPCIYTGVG